MRGSADWAPHLEAGDGGLARIAGWQPPMRRPLPGNEVLWRAYVQLQMMVRVTQAARAPSRTRSCACVRCDQALGGKGMF